METALRILYVAFGIAGMELFSWAVHKYLMHGPLWAIHRTHHEKSNSFFELNDLFSLFFGSMAFALIYLGAKDGYSLSFWIGMGISAYGLVYFILHDSLIHQRIFLGKCPPHWWFQGIREAHKAHHRSLRKEGAVSFGLLWVSRKYFRTSTPSKSGKQQTA